MFSLYKCCFNTISILIFKLLLLRSVIKYLERVSWILNFSYFYNSNQQLTSVFDYTSCQCNSVLCETQDTESEHWMCPPFPWIPTPQKLLNIKNKLVSFHGGLLVNPPVLFISFYPYPHSLVNKNVFSLSCYFSVSCCSNILQLWY